jgi:acyl dehydratase
MSDVKSFEKTPNLNGLLLKCLVARGSKEIVLPQLERTLSETHIETSHLKAYNRVCGFVDRAVLPPTYLHMLAFPLVLDMVVDKSFPFKAMGIVHVRNEITQLRPLRCSENISMHCELDNLQKVNKGYEFDVVATARVKDEVVWTSTITNLARVKTSDELVENKEKEHEEMDWSNWSSCLYTLPSNIGRQYASVSGDYNPIHLFPMTAKLLGFKRTIAHGMWVKALMLAKHEHVYKNSESFNIKVKFKLPVFIPTKINLFIKGNDNVFDIWVRDKKTDKPHLESTITILDESV